MTEVERLTAIEDVKFVKARYFRFADSKDMVSMRTLFADDCEVDMRGALTDPVTGVDALPAIGEQVLRGVDAVMAAYEAGQDIVTVHHGYNPEVEILSDTAAKAIWSMTDRLFFSEIYPIAAMTGYGYYHEAYEKIDGAWKIKSIRLTRLRVEIVQRD